VKLVIGDIYVASVTATNKKVRAVLSVIDNGYGYAILKRIGVERWLFWNINNPPKGVTFSKEDEAGK
jgi:hypothetical protein